MDHYPWLYQPITPVIVGLLISVSVWGYRFRKKKQHLPNYFTVFVNASALYVFICMALSNRLWGISYADMLESGFGYDEIYIALIFSAYHFGREIIKAAKQP